MAAAVLSPTAMSPRGGILLNTSPCNSPRLGQCIPQTPSSQSLSSSMSDASTNSWFKHPTHDMQRSASAPGAARRQRIRFAPLPDPRADESDDTSLTEPSEEQDSLSSSKLFTTEGVELSPKISPASCASSTHSTITAPPKKPALNLLRPLAFLKRAPSPCPSVGSDSEQGGSSSRLARISTEDILTLGTINLFRPSSRTTLDSDRRGRRYSDSSPENDNDPSSKKRPRQGSNASNNSNASPRLTSQPLDRARSAPSSPQQGITMLNGRVYGGKRKSKRTHNLFASARDEPEFVEWGYGGMGSVHADHAGNSMYRNLQSGGTALGLKMGHGSASGGGTVDEDDDGSGMGWVKRRREQREREKKEAEERERAVKEAQKQKEAAEEADVESGSEEKMAVEASELPAEEKMEDESTRVASPSSENAENQHILKTVSIPGHHRSHSHSSHHKSPSLSRSLSPAAEDQNPIEVVLETSPTLEKDEKDSTESSTESDSEVEEQEKDEDEDEDEDDAEENRKTAIGAGMEKISRHKEER
ncbi:hypothetical protein CONPUDRAFT_135215 [Coniophora puteana RWD-64-598 SS2]|uniref:Uncharacterized protein n=1 Tax=Coniophora puteana (strain RWD-64-598) TaxID=741705 RepID=A0A5M3N269_CONPW|nr:uncharacterized protein CONPUDRAFT_135215 [Coniophora puteana RWD-64-598 SS2]EIW85483.1 hypothetical protein CONPUDRAFT_135215 [Coniophora puteana RWD-64-598 SS2]